MGTSDEWAETSATIREALPKEPPPLDSGVWEGIDKLLDKFEAEARREPIPVEAPAPPPDPPTALERLRAWVSGRSSNG